MTIPAKKASTPAPAPPPLARVAFEKITRSTVNRIVLYGTGGIGKTSLTLKLPGRTAYLDRDNSLGKLEIDPERHFRIPCTGWKDARASLAASGWDQINNIVCDSASELEKDCLAYILATVKAEKNTVAKSIEDYGWGKGYRYFYETFLLLLADLDRHFRQGRNVILVCHEVAAKVPNPQGEDWIRYEPDLYQSDKVSVRAKVKNWADQVLFLGYDVSVKDGIGQGSGTRTLYTAERPHCMAKSRTCQETIVIEDINFDPWPAIGVK